MIKVDIKWWVSGIYNAQGTTVATSGANGNYLDGKFDLTEIGKPFTVLSYWDKTNDTSSLVSPTPKPIDEWFFNPSTKVELFSPAINGTKIYHTSLSAGPG